MLLFLSLLHWQLLYILSSHQGLRAENKKSHLYCLLRLEATHADLTIILKQLDIYYWKLKSSFY